MRPMTSKTRMALPRVNNEETDDMTEPVNQKPEKGQTMWGGRFSAQPGALMQAINVSIDFDQKLAAQDILGSKAHATMLKAQSIISEKDCQAIHQGLDEILEEINTLNL